MGRRGCSLLALAFCGFCFWVLWLSTGPLRGFRAARAHSPVISDLLFRYPEFQRVHVGAGNWEGGVLVVSGDVQSPEQLDRLKALVASTLPPTHVRYFVRVGGKTVPPKE